MMTSRSRWLLITTILSGLILAGYCAKEGFAAGKRGDHSSRRLLEIEDEVNRRLGIPLPSTPVARAAFSDWSDLIRNLHRAASRARLSEFVYTTGQMIPVTDPRDRLSLPAMSDTENDKAADTSEVKETPYRAMTVKIDGGGRYDQIVRFVEELALSEPPMTLDRISISAGPYGPRFVAEAHLTTALPVETVADTFEAIDLHPSTAERDKP